jgi:hypothetical protein
MNTPTSRFGALAGSTLPQRKSPLAPVAQHQPFRVLQSGHAPAQLSLFLRPGLTPR